MSQPRILVAIITGGRPRLEQRPTRSRIIPSLMEHGGFTDFEWVIREDHVEEYEADDLPFNVYPLDFVDEYAPAHWRHPTAEYERGAFAGAFSGREWAMGTAEERGYDMVLQMDDNIIKVGVLNANNRNFHPEGTNPGMVFRLISELVWSTNVGMGGPQLSSIRPQLKAKTIRPGFPYSAFFEKVTLYRPPYFGPFEDDIMHAMDYGLGHSPLTTGVVPTLTYAKESSSSSGMRKHYDATRGLELTRRYPLNASLQVGPKTSSPNDTDKGVRHYLNTKGFTPIRVTDRERFLSAQETLVEWVNAGMERFKESTRPKIRERAGMGE